MDSRRWHERISADGRARSEKAEESGGGGGAAGGAAGGQSRTINDPGSCRRSSHVATFRWTKLDFTFVKGKKNCPQTSKEKHRIKAKTTEIIRVICHLHRQRSATDQLVRMMLITRDRSIDHVLLG